jgi:hypothetical protein
MLRRSRQRGHRLGPSELEQQLEVQLRLRRLVERPPQRRDGSVWVAPRDRGVGRRAQHVYDPLCPACRHDEQMCAHLFLRSAELDENRGCTLVVQLALARCEVVVNGRLHQRVDEADWRFGSQDLGAYELSGCRGHGRCLELRERAHDGDLGAVTQDGDRSRDLHGICRESCKAEQHRSRCSPRPELGDDLDMARLRRNPIGDERLQKLVEQERVAVGRGMTRLGEGSLDTLAHPVTHDFRHRRRRKRPGREHLNMWLGSQLFQDGLIGLGLRRPHAGHEHDRKVVKRAAVEDAAFRGRVADVRRRED